MLNPVTAQIDPNQYPMTLPITFCRLAIRVRGLAPDKLDGVCCMYSKCYVIFECPFQHLTQAARAAKDYWSIFQLVDVMVTLSYESPCVKIVVYRIMSTTIFHFVWVLCVCVCHGICHVTIVVEASGNSPIPGNAAPLRGSCSSCQVTLYWWFALVAWGLTPWFL